MDYQVKIYIPSKDSFGYTNELKNRQALTISKYIKANDEHGLCIFLDHILEQVSPKDIIDKFLILIQLRALNIGNNVTLKAKHISGSDATYTVNLFSFLGRCLEQLKTLKREYTFIDNDLKIVFGLPKNIYFANIYALINDSVKNIFVNGEDILLNKSSKERFEIIYKLKKEVIIKIKKFFNEINRELDLFLVQSTDEILVPNIKISFFNNTIFNVLKSLYKTEISYFYNKFYICLTKLGLSYESFLNLSPVETDILLNIYKSVNKLK